MKKISYGVLFFFLIASFAYAGITTITKTSTHPVYTDTTLVRQTGGSVTSMIGNYEANICYHIEVPCTAQVDSFVTWGMDVSGYPSITVHYWIDTGDSSNDSTVSINIGYQQSPLPSAKFATPTGYSSFAPLGTVNTMFADSTGGAVAKIVAPIAMQYLRFYFYPDTTTGGDAHNIAEDGILHFRVTFLKSPNPLSYRNGDKGLLRRYPESIQIAAKIYLSPGLTLDDVALIAARTDLLITDGSGDGIAGEMKVAAPEILLFRYIMTPWVVNQELGQFKSVVWDQDMPDDWYWPDDQADTIWKVEDKTYYVIPYIDGATGWPDFFADGVLDYIGDRPFDGVHGDMAAQFMSQYWDEYDLLENYFGGSEESFGVQQEGQIQRLHSRFNDAGLLFITNNIGINNPYFLPVRVFSIDGFNHQWLFMQKTGEYSSEAATEALMDTIDIALGLGQMCVLQAGPNWDQEEMNYCVHAYMLISNNPYTYFAFDFGVNEFSNFQRLHNNYSSAFEKDFGQPLGVRYKEDGIWKRQFTNGLLQIDLVNHTYSFV